MSLEQDVATAQQAVDRVEQACALVRRHFGDTVDARRLRVDIARLRDDLALLCGARTLAAHGSPSAGAFWGDGFDEGFGPAGSTAP